LFPIPKILHYVWLGTGSMHPLMLEWQWRWAALHPGWLVKTWRQVSGLPPHLLACEDEVVECRCPSYLSRCPTPAKQSDVWRYDILEQLGGVYLDADVEPVKNIEPLLENTRAFAGLCQTFYHWNESAIDNVPALEVGCSIMGATAHHPWLRDLCSGTPSQDPEAVISLSFPYLTEVTAKHPDVRLLDPTVFYPLTWNRYSQEDHRKLNNEVLPESTYAVHRWSSTWYPKKLPSLDLKGPQ
jgi:mannosyltransferase OCH1-like enzyme